VLGRNQNLLLARNNTHEPGAATAEPSLSVAAMAGVADGLTSGQISEPRPPRIAKFARHASVFTAANLTCLAMNGIIAFLLPRLLSMEAYGYYRLFLLYGSFAGVVHLGFLDGLLMRWAENPGERLPAELAPAFRFLGIEHALVLFPVAFGVIMFSSLPHTTILVLAITAYAWLWNWLFLGQCALQALKSFSPLSLVVVAPPALLLIGALYLSRIGLLTLGSILAAYILANTIAAVGQWMYLRRRFQEHPPRRTLEVGWLHIRLGWSVLGANLVAMLVVSLDRIVVSARFSIREFALYSFAANALGLTYSAILSVATVIFPYLSEGLSPKGLVRAYHTGEAAVLLLWALGITSYFPLAWMVGAWIPNYVESLPLIRVLLLTTGLAAGIHIVHSPYFRIARQQRSFLIGALIGLMGASVFLALAVHGRRLTYFTWAMAGAALAWWMSNEILLARMFVQSQLAVVRRLCLMALCAIVFLLCTSLGGLMRGAILYAAWLMIFGVIVKRDAGELMPWSRGGFNPASWFKNVFAD